MHAPYTLGRYWIKTSEHEQMLFAIVSEVFEHELVLTDVRVHPKGEVVYLQLIVGRAAVREARSVDWSAPGQQT
jgi:hypothetical protein